MCLVISPEVIIVNLLQKDKKNYIEISTLNLLCDEIENQLRKMKELKNESVRFDINYDAIERTVVYNSQVFLLVGDRIYRKDIISSDLVNTVNGRNNESIVKAICAAVKKIAA